MKLKKISVENYRSIKSLELDAPVIAEQSCTILLGINESGKSNILKAIALLDKNTNFNYDKDGEKESRKTSQPVKLKFTFELAKDDLQAIFAELVKAGLPEDSLRIKVAIKEITYGADSKRKENWRLEIDNTDFPIDELIISEKDMLVKKEIPLQSGKEVTTETLRELIERKTAETVLDKLCPRAIYWKPSPNYIISQPVDINDFSNKLNNVPLKNIFALAGMTNQSIQTNIQRAKKEHDDRTQLERDLSLAATTHINEVWPEHKVDISVRIEMNGVCTVYVSDKDSSSRTFSMEDRSDGFKQFVSILLTLSAENRSNELKNFIILVDEPENSLHPSSVQYLRDELLRISINNNLFVASHSIFLVDKKNVNRHVKVCKEQGETKAERIKKDNPFAEEVIYRAFGTSLFELIEPNMLIFEGSSDLDIYRALMLKLPQLQMPNVGTISASGVTEIRKYVKFCNQKTVTGIAVVDSDQEGKNELKHIKQTSPEFANNIYELSELADHTDGETTLEDLIPEEIVIETCKEVYKLQLTKIERPVVKCLKALKMTNGIKKDYNLEEFKTAMTRKVIADMKLESKVIERKYDRYLKFAKTLNKKIESVSRVVPRGQNG